MLQQDFDNIIFDDIEFDTIFDSDQSIEGCIFNYLTVDSEGYTDNSTCSSQDIRDTNWSYVWDMAPQKNRGGKRKAENDSREAESEGHPDTQKKQRSSLELFAEGMTEVQNDLRALRVANTSTVQGDVGTVNIRLLTVAELGRDVNTGTTSTVDSAASTATMNTIEDLPTVVEDVQTIRGCRDEEKEDSPLILFVIDDVPINDDLLCESCGDIDFFQLCLADSSDVIAANILANPGRRNDFALLAADITESNITEEKNRMGSDIKVKPIEDVLAETAKLREVWMGFLRNAVVMSASKFLELGPDAHQIYKIILLPQISRYIESMEGEVKQFLNSMRQLYIDDRGPRYIPSFCEIRELLHTSNNIKTMKNIVNYIGSEYNLTLPSVIIYEKGMNFPEFGHDVVQVTPGGLQNCRGKIVAADKVKKRVKSIMKKQADLDYFPNTVVLQRVVDSVVEVSFYVTLSCSSAAIMVNSRKPCQYEVSHIVEKFAGVQKHRYTDKVSFLYNGKLKNKETNAPLQKMKKAIVDLITAFTDHDNPFPKHVHYASRTLACATFGLVQDADGDFEFRTKDIKMLTDCDLQFESWFHIFNVRSALAHLFQSFTMRKLKYTGIKMLNTLE